MFFDAGTATNKCLAHSNKSDPQGSEGAVCIPRVRPDPKQQLPPGPHPRNNRRSDRARPPEASGSLLRSRSQRQREPIAWHFFCKSWSSDALLRGPENVRLGNSL
jgi:hypothetical protein